MEVLPTSETANLPTLSLDNEGFTFLSEVLDKMSVQ
jgi:hypothetical protein